MDLAERIAKLSPRQRELLELKLKQQGIDISQVPITPVDRRGTVYFPLSFGQERLWFIQQLEPGSFAYNIVLTAQLTGNLNKEILEKSIREIIRRHEALRTVFTLHQEKPVQVILPRLSLPLKIRDFRNIPPEQQEMRVKETIREGSRFVFDLTKGPLLRIELLELSETRYIFFLVIHHIIFDGTSSQVFLKEISRLYEAYCRGSAAPMPELPVQYVDYAAWQRRRLGEEAAATQLKKKQETYWLELFAGEIPVLNLPTDFPRPPVQGFGGKSLAFELKPDEVKALKEMVLNQKITLYILLLAIYNVFLARLTGMQDIIVGTPLAGRSQTSVQEIIGMFVNTLPIRNFPAPDKTFTGFLQQVREETLRVFENQDIRYEDIVARAAVHRDTSRNPLFDVVFLLENFEFAEIDIPGLQWANYDYEVSTAKFDLTLGAIETAGSLRFSFEYCTRLFKQETIERFVGYFQRLVGSIIKHPDREITALEILPEAEKKKILYDFNNTAIEYPEYPADSMIHRLFTEQAGKTPHRIASVAVEQRQETLYPAFVTYAALNEKSDSIARFLKAKGVQAGTFVGISLRRSNLMIAAIFGILKAGAAYIPIDPDYPEERIQYILIDSGAKFLFTCCNLSNMSKGESQCSPEIRPPKKDRSEPGYSASGCTSAIAYMIYTSGTTGKPKGVLVEHRSLANLCSWHNRYFQVKESDIASQYAGISFDAAVWEIFPYLLRGAALHIVGDETRLDIDKLGAYYDRHNITIGFLPTQVCQQFMRQENFSLRVLLTGGDKLQSFYKRRYVLYNNYGPTENTVVATCSPVEEYVENIPIGKPIDNNQVYILGKDNFYIQPIGAAGELCIAGDSLSLGYLNQPELTAEKFVSGMHGAFLKNRPLHPQKTFNKSFCGGQGGSFLEKRPLALVYKTGDLARWRADGNIEFLGRIDQQVKIRGFRVELGEIENCLLGHERVKQAVVIARESPTDEKNLCAYIVIKNAEPAGTPSEPPTSADLREYLAKTLPHYMIPGYFVFLDQIPLNRSGKIDRQALPQPLPGRGVRDYTPPGSELEKKLVQVWADVLQIPADAVGIDANFFELGGHSLKATQLAARIHREFDVSIRLIELFQFPTVRALSLSLEAAAKERFVSIEPVEKREYYPQSSTQKRLFFLERFDDIGVAYNVPSIFKISGRVDMAKLERTALELIRRHESLRTSFHLVDDRPVQRIHEPRDIEFAVENRTAAGFVRPFVLSRSPLMRLAVDSQNQDETMLCVDMHHIITDRVSQEILVSDFLDLYRTSEIAPLRIQYKDYSQWRMSPQVSNRYKNQQEYWLDVFADEIPTLNLPTDEIRPEIQSYAGASIDFALTPEITRKLRALAQHLDLTMYMLLLAVFKILLYRLAGQEDIIVGAAVAARRHTDLQKIIGMFVNTIALRNFPAGDKPLKTFLLEVKDRTLKAYENQEYPFEELVEQLNVHRDASRNPIFDVMFNVLDETQAAAAESGFPARKQNNQKLIPQTSKFDITFTGIVAAEKILFNVEYSAGLFHAATMQRMIGYFQTILRSLPANLEGKIADIEILNEEEKIQILEKFNDTAVDFSQGKTVHLLFEEQVERTPHKAALVFNDYSVTYAGLNKRANRIAHSLRSRGVAPGNAVGLLLERSIEMIAGMIGIMKAGAAYLPIDPEYPLDRKSFMLLDSTVKWLLIDETVKEQNKLIPQGVQAIDLGSKKLYQGKSDNPAHINNTDDPLYLMYTSGSTGRPKGVMLEHRNLINLLLYGFSFTNLDFSAVLQFATISFDASFHEIFSTLLHGGKLCLIDKRSRTNIPALFKVIERNKIKTVFLPISFLKIIFNEAEYAKNFPRCIEHIQTAGDQVVISEAFSRFLKTRRIYLHNHYGPTEAHVVTALTLHPAGDIPALPSIGKPVSNTQIYIFDKYWNMQPIGIPGELYIGGVQVSRGYLNQPELTAEKFVQGGSFRENHPPAPPAKAFDKSFLGVQGAIFQKSPLVAEGKIYKTGDLARWRPDGNIEFLGRIDFQVKIRGFRVEPTEIEARLLNHEDIRQAVVLVRQGADKEKYLCAYFSARGKTGKSLNIPRLREYLAGCLPDYMIPAYFVQLEQLPLNPSGKVDRQALPEPEIKPGMSYAAPTDEIQEKLVNIWAEVLGAARDKIGVDDNFFELGGHSLKGTILLSRLYREFNVDIPLAYLFKTPNIRGLAAWISKSEAVKYMAPAPTEKKEYYPLSSVQQRLYILDQMEFDSIAYNLPSLFRLTGKLDKAGLEHALRILIERHESFRTSFITVNNVPRQRIHAPQSIECTVEYHKTNSPQTTQDRPETGFLKHFIRHFDLSHAPLLRVGLIEQADDEYILAIDMPHIISDGVSLQIFKKEIVAAYNAQDLPPIKIQYRDFSAWRSRGSQEEKVSKQQAFWFREFAGEMPVLHIPQDYPRPPVQSFVGQTLNFVIEREQNAALRKLAKEESATLFMLLSALFDILLYRLSGREDIVIGTPIAARRHPELEKIIGVFVNTLAMRNYPVGEKRFLEFLAEVKQNTLAAFENQEYPFEELVEQSSLAINKDAGRNPIFDVLFVLQNVPQAAVEYPGLRLIPYEYDMGVAKFDITLTAIEESDELLFSLEYCTKLFKKETILGFIDYFKNVISAAVENPDTRLCEIEIIPAWEKNRILYEFNDTAASYPGDKTIHSFFEQQAEKNPHHIALKSMLHEEGDTLIPAGQAAFMTYGELNERANRLALVLLAEGVVPGAVVGLSLERSFDMMIGIFSIMKAGGIYLPIDPKYPQERIAYMLKDSSARLLVTPGSLVKEGKEVKRWESEIYHIEALARSPYPQHSSNIAYLIYTSGSTGNPKGVMIEHYSLVNRLHWMQEAYPLDEHDVILQKTTIVFDVSLWELFWWSMAGAQLCLLQPAAEKDPELITAAINRNKVTTIHFVPSMLNVFLEYLESSGDIEMSASLRWVFASGEALMPYHVQKFTRLLNRTNKTNGSKLVNLYGPTEAAIDVSYYNCFHEQEQEYGGAIPIGKPIDNICLYIIDKYMQLQGIGIPGELLIAGAGLGRGYLNQPELTAEKFVNLASGGQGGSFRENHPPALPVKAFDKSFLGVQGAILQKSPLVYKTGDLARWLPDGNIEFLGRIDFQVKIRGFRIELGEIENRLLFHPDVKEALATIKTAETDEEDNWLCAYIVPAADRLDIADLRNYLSGKLPEYMIPAYFVRLESMPLTANGKIDRKALPEPQIETTVKYAPPRSKLEIELAAIWSEILALEKEKIGIDDRFFDLGGHSLKAAIMISKIQEKLGLKISLSRAFAAPTIRSLAKSLQHPPGAPVIYIQSVEKKEYYPLSSAQEQFYILHCMERENTAYNVQSISLWEGELDPGKLEKTFCSLMKRHESLHTAFLVQGKTPVQAIKNDVTCRVEYFSPQLDEYPSSLDDEIRSLLAQIIRNFIRPFDLACPPLFRVGLIKSGENRYVLVVDMNHIITDGFSLDILVREFMYLYGGAAALPPLVIQFKDFSVWQQSRHRQETLIQQEAWWLMQFPQDDEITRLDLPLDYERSALSSTSTGSRIGFTIDQEETAALKTLARQEEATLFMVMLALVNTLLYGLCGQEDIVIGAPAVNRGQPYLEPIIGPFLNTLALRNFPEGAKIFREFLKEIKQLTLLAYENQDYPYEKLVDRLAAQRRDSSRNPLFDVLLAFQDTPVIPGLLQGASIPGVSIKPYPIEAYRSPFDLAFLVFEIDRKIDVFIYYRTSLFAAETIREMTDNFKEIISSVLHDPDICLEDIFSSDDMLAASSGGLMEDQGDFGF